MNTYRPTDLKPQLDDYGPAHFEARQQATDARKNQLQRIYDDLTPSELEDRARSNMWRAQGACYRCSHMKKYFLKKRMV